MNESLDLVDHATRMINDFLSTPSALRAVVFGLLLSWLGTQLLKFAPQLEKWADRDQRFGVRALAFIIGYFSVIVLWPDTHAVRYLLAVITGLASPAAYSALTVALYHYLPWLEPKMSARPSSPDVKPEI